MKNFYYALKQVFRLRWINVIKIVSLSLGFTVSVALMCRMAWSHNFDNFWQDVENLQILERNAFLVNTEEEVHIDRCYPGIAPEIAANIASVESATRFQYPQRTHFLVNENQFAFHIYKVDTSFFDVFKIQMITEGNPKIIIENRSNVIISEETAALLFPDGNVLGQEIKNENDIYTVSGICKDLLENSSFLPNMQLIIGIDMPLVFGDDDDYFTFLRTYKKTNFQKLTQEINELLEPRYEHLADFLGVIMSFKVTNIHDYSKVFDIKATIMAFLLLLITGLNFALLSISSLVSRAKEVGVRKASGARTSGIFSLIIWETAIYVLMAALLSCALFWGLKPEIEEMFGNYENLFAFENIWAVGVVFVALIVFAGVIPAWIFSQIPVTQIFQRFTTNRILWKRILLFIQFMVSIFVISVMFIALRQYQATINYRYGYEPEKLIWMRIDSHTETQLQSFLSDIETDSRIEALNLSSMSVWYGFSGDHVSRKPNAADPLFIKSLSTDSNFFSTHGIKILQGNSDLTANWRTGGNVVVNEALLHFFNIEGNPLGEVLYSGSIPFTIVGVCQNFESLHVAEGVKPLMVLARDTNNTRYLTIRVNEVTADVVKMIREKVKQHDPNTIVPEVNTCSDTIYWYFHRLLLDGKITVFASICLLLITIMGILGYVNIELRHRTKEIAIRKIHGSTAGAIIWKLTRELLFIALLTVPVAIPFAYMFGIRWQRDFLVKAELSWYLFACAILIIVLTIVICAVIQTWRAANANPARAIKKE